MAGFSGENELLIMVILARKIYLRKRHKPYAQNDGAVGHNLK
jgi:hypothetical protein